MNKVNLSRDAYERPMMTSQYFETEGCFLNVSDIDAKPETDVYDQNPTGDGEIEF